MWKAKATCYTFWYAVFINVLYKVLEWNSNILSQRYLIVLIVINVFEVILPNIDCLKLSFQMKYFLILKPSSANPPVSIATQWSLSNLTTSKFVVSKFRHSIIATFTDSHGALSPNNSILRNLNRNLNSLCAFFLASYTTMDVTLQGALQFGDPDY